MKNLKRMLSFVMVLAMVLSLLPAHVATAAEQSGTAQASSTYEPWCHGYRFVDILHWDPATDDYSDELVAKVPLQDRIGTFAATQANPWLLDQARLYAISSSGYRNTDTSNGPWNGGMAYEDFGMNLFKFWQYTDMTGAGGRPTEEIDAETKALIGSFEYGTIAIPQASATNAAHMNGVLSLAEYFTPRVPQISEEWLYQDEDGNYPYAQKLIDIMNYYGFDGYFINQEEYIPSDYVPLFRDMLKWMCEQGAYIQWYDSIGDGGSISYQNKFNDYNDGWIWNEEDGRVTDSIFLNYWYSSTALKDSKAHAESLGLDPYEVVYMGVEGGQWKFSRDLDSYHNAVDENNQPYTSFAIWGSDWYQDQYDRTDNNRYKPEYQWDVEERERMYFTSAAENAGTYSVGTVTRDDVNAGTINFQGFSKYVVEKSVIDGTVFSSNFSTGHGMQYFIDGEVSRDVEWSNLNIQSILPTWQWWMESEGSALTLDMDWDYGPEFSRHQGAFPYTQVGAYNGGNSIVIYGNLDDTHMVNLYKTELDVTANSEISLTYHKTSADDASQIGIAVTFKNGNEAETVVLPIADSGKQTGWTTATVDLGEYAGKVIAAIGVELSTTEAVEDYQINLGYLEVSDGNDYTPAAPTGVKLEKKFDYTNEIQISWDIADYSDVINYHVYAIYADGSERFVGGAYAENYYIQTLEDRENVVALELRAVGIDGSESAGTQVALSDNGISNVMATSADNQLVVTWDGGEAEVELKYFYSDKVAPAAQTGNGTVTFDIDVEDGEDYILTLTNDDGFVNYFGELVDKYCDPYVGVPQRYSNGTFDFTLPLQGDWKVMTMIINGSERNLDRFGSSTLERINVGSTGMSSVVITVTDIYGNTSTPTTLMFMDGEIADMTAEYGSDRFPDEALLEAIREIVGPTLQDLVDYTDPLDLSDLGIEDLTGLSSLSGVTEIDLSGNAFTELTASMLPAGIKKITLDNCENLETIKLDGKPELEVVLGDLPALVNLSLNGYGDYPLDLSGCPELQNLYLTGTQMTELDISANVKLHNFTIDASQISSLTAADASAYTDAYYWKWTGAKMDLSETTAEGEFMAGMKEYFENADLVQEIGGEPIMIKNRHEIDFYYPTVNNVIDLGKEYLLYSLELWTRSPDYYGYLGDFTVQISSDGSSYTELAHISGNSSAEYAVPIPENTYAQFIKIIDNGNTEAWSYWTVYAYDVAPMGFYYNNQQPAMEKDAIEALDIVHDGADYNTLELLNDWYATAHTVAGGTLAADLFDADWIDQNYLNVQAVAPSGVRVTITDEDGNTYEYPTEGPTLGDIIYTALPVQNVIASGAYSGEEATNMFDGSETSKWCTGNNGAWTVFELEEPRVIGEWFTLHAGIESNSMITYKYRLQVLNTDVVSEDSYLSADNSGKRSFAGNAANWTDLIIVDQNSENEVSVEVELEKLTEAQVYRIIVDEYVQPGAQYGAVRIYETELYAYEGGLGANVNGMFKADEVGTYTVSYKKAGTELVSTTIDVGHDVGDALIENPTCTEPGHVTYECSLCDEAIVEEIPALGHDYESVVTPPTTTSEGYTTHTCTRCGDSYVDSYVDKLPDETEPEVTEPEVTEPEVTEPEVTDPEVTDPEVPATSKPAGDDDSADTGDSFNALWIFVMTISLMGAAAVLVINKKRLF